MLLGGGLGPGPSGWPGFHFSAGGSAGIFWGLFQRLNPERKAVVQGEVRGQQYPCPGVSTVACVCGPG